ncbi:MAG: carbohydrate kinase [Hyphomonadaceae bacterium JAD_PAG50586_4]|nr:MAG: carbohydrate kinase [Hyphomonadaceae bacterium JAD_PAG50586_4]
MHLVCGEALFDVFVSDDTCASNNEVALKAIAGGSPFNVAIGMARLGARIGFGSDIARDALGERLAAMLAEEGISDRFLRRGAPSTALAIVSSDHAGKPSYSFSGLEAAIYCPDEDARNSEEDAVTGVHIGSIAIVMPNSARQLVELVRQFHERALISLDPNVRLSIEPDPATWRRAIDELRPWCHVIKVSEEDVAALYGAADAEEICRSWLNDRTALVVLTKGAEGAMIMTATERVEIAPADIIVVDSVGAGDSFMAAMLSKLVDGGWCSSKVIAALGTPQLFEIGAYAAHAAGVTCSRRGPVLPTSRDLESSARGS